MTTATVPATRTTRLLLGLGAAAFGAMLVNAVIATVTLGLDDSALPVGLNPAAYLSMSVLGVLLGAAGWAVVRRVAAQPAAVLRVLVPAAVVLTWVPDVIVLVGGATVTNIAGLMLMHVVVATSAVLALRRVLPV